MQVDVFGVSLDPVLIGSYFVVLVVSLWFLRRFFAGGWCYSTARLDGKTVVITGANTGIGKETAKDLAGRGARVILACRDLAKAEAAAQEVSKDTGSNNVAVYKLDLASLASVRECAEKIKSQESRLDVLINNAGIMMCPEWKTEEGYEMQFGVNHLGHFLFTNLLLDLIKASAPSRIVNVSSLAHQVGKMHWDDIHMREKYSPLGAYGQSKLANILFTRELSKRLKGSGVNVYALHPGSVVTELTRYTAEALSFPLSIIFIIMDKVPFARFVLKTPVQGAQTSIYCTVAEELNDKTGLYYSDCAVQKPSSEALDDDAARRLWEISAEMVGLEKKIN